MVNRALQGLDLAGLDLVIIENVGNLVRRASSTSGARQGDGLLGDRGEDKPPGSTR